MKARTFLLTLFVTLTLASPVLSQGNAPSAQEPLVLTDEQGRYPLGRHMDILEDPGGELGIEEVASPEYASRFAPSQQEIPNLGYTNSVFWLRLRLRNETRATGQWLLEADFQNLNYIDLYIPLEGGGYEVKESGALRPFDTREVPYYHIVFHLPLTPQEEKSFYLRVESGSAMTLGFTLWSPEAFALNKIRDILFIGLFYGSLLIMLGYHLFAFSLLREANHFYFVLFLASSILFWATYEGIADQYLWPAWSQEKRPLLIITMALFFIAALKFGDVFLDQKKRARRIHQLSNLFIGLWGLMIVIVPFSSYYTMSILTFVLVLTTLVVPVLAGFHSWRTGYHPAQFYLISWLGFIVGTMSVELVRSGFLPSNAFTEKSYQLGLIWLVLMWSLALADRIKQLKIVSDDANLKLAQSEHKLSQILEGLPIGVAVYGIDRKVIYANRRAINILANPGKGIIPDVSARRSLAQAMSYFSFRVAGSDQAYSLERMPIWSAYDGQGASADDIEADLIDRRVPLEFWANPVKDEHGRVESVVAAFQDITQRRRAQAELEEYRLKLEEMVSQRTAQLSAVNAQLQVENAERRRLEDMLRWRLEWLVVVNQISQAVSDTGDLPQVYQTLTDTIKHLFSASDVFLVDLDPGSEELKLAAHTCRNEAHADLAGSVLALPAIISSHQPFERGVPIILPREQLAGLEGPAGVHFSETQNQTLVCMPLSDAEGTTGFLGLEFFEAERRFSVEETALIEKICLDIAQVREKAYLAERTRALIAVEERNRLARDLHDSVTQMLFAASLVADVLPQIWRREPRVALSSLEELRRLTRGALAEMRTLLLELRPAAVLKTPLSDLLTQLTEAVTARTNLSFQLFIEQTPPLPEEVHIGFYRIAQESLNNVVKHARASQVSVSLSANSQTADPNGAWSGEVKLMVQDNGRGFNEPETGTGRLGLGIMRERAAAIGAYLSVESQPGNGTTVSLIWHN